MAGKLVQTQKDTGDDTPTPGLDLRWHLAESAVEVDTTELEFALMRTFEGFGRWQSECLASVCDLAATGPENALLHIIRMNDRPKTIKDLARLTNRDDVPNIQYSLRKLIGAGLVLRRGAGRSGVTYVVTEEGRHVTDAYGALRRRLLLQAVAGVPGFSDRLAEATRTLNLLSGIYEEISRVAATHRRG
ncbi:winged helix DNA-binding protein [Tabrizicola sp.]|uniref:winged helix DNA-binding protein n=1 Tax=Tabrizicola sp. TaxID=2005166 RepID=UPI001A4EA3F9|nr:winged helix DNA-binding protein [Tabrizicola sp.]MBL9064035.1 winged helix DNA-binding protein [Tabrizicola sp.]